MIAEWEPLSAALRNVPGLRVSTTPGETLDPPTAALGPPTWTYEVYGPEPTGHSLTVAIVVAADDRAMDNLARLVPLAVAAIHEHTDGAVTLAEPGSWPSSGSPDLPAYLLTIEV